MSTQQESQAEALVLAQDALRQADLQIQYLHQKFNETGSGNGVRSQISHALTALSGLPQSSQQEQDATDAELGRHVRKLIARHAPFDAQDKPIFTCAFRFTEEAFTEHEAIAQAMRDPS